MYIKAAFVVILVQGVISKERGESCLTPNDETATCIPANQCKVILDGILSKNASAIDFAKESQCGYDTSPLVCCGTSAHYNVRSRMLANIDGSIFPNETMCGKDKLEDRIIFGERTELGEFPWMAGLEYMHRLQRTSSGIKCGGSIITDRYILTAAHCLEPLYHDLVRVKLGEWQVSTDPDCTTLVAIRECADPVQKFGIELRIPHPRYNASSGAHDIALLKLNRKIPYTDYIRPICLPDAEIPDPELQTHMFVAGWGVTENKSSSDIKLKVQVPIQSIDTCTKKLGVPITTNQLCAGGDGAKDSCKGDSGGPLMKKVTYSRSAKDQWYQEGVVSWGIGCGRPGYPAVYTRVSKYIPWIIDTITKK